MIDKKLLTVPNVLSFYRLASFPFVLYLALHHDERLFVVFLVINLVTDALDGFIARTFNQKTEIGARLDSIADVGTYILAVTGIFVFKMQEFNPYMTSFIVLIVLFFSTDILSLIKFKRVSSLHLYSWKIGGYIQGGFFLVLFTIGFFPAFYYFTLWWGILSSLENILVQLFLSEMKSNQKGLYWVLRNQRL
ncbi:CDP-alcohol phosphatidyltransferase family protein [Mangrovibacterium lignilyticum]|uniref:CDP-alcohol phosphatidyltransferase family protein n=1 Tax=Mangrovibacterium lignilyticum TaxID=2668052 RepID=UPI0013D43CD7|nr:CDP-alcohol phosphatidyltransferase family protein [Mangrovibacterium lignilyticum]